MSARDVIAGILFEYSGSGQCVDEMLAEIATAQADAIISGLEASGRSIVHKDEIHAPSVRGDDNELLIEWPGQIVLTFSPGEDCGYAIFRDGKWRPGKFKILDEAKQAAEEINAALRELMKEKGRG